MAKQKKIEETDIPEKNSVKNMTKYTKQDMNIA